MEYILYTHIQTDRHTHLVAGKTDECVFSKPKARVVLEMDISLSQVLQVDFRWSHKNEIILRSRSSSHLSLVTPGKWQPQFGLNKAQFNSRC